MADFLTAFSKTLKYEGGWCNEANDDGNWTGGKKGVGNLVGTNYGITAPEMSKFLGRTATVEDMKNMSIEVPRKIYKEKYWDVVKGDLILNQEAADSIFDNSVNMGQTQAMKIAQRSLLIEETGKMDDKTLNLLNNL